MLQVQYTLVYESVHKDALLSEWRRLTDADCVRPTPPPPPDGFFASLRSGDQVEVYFEAGWWPVTVKAVHGPHAVTVSHDVFAGLCRRIAATQVRPRWRYRGMGSACDWANLTLELRSDESKES